MAAFPPHISGGSPRKDKALEQPWQASGLYTFVCLEPSFILGLQHDARLRTLSTRQMSCIVLSVIRQKSETVHVQRNGQTNLHDFLRELYTPLE
jgi:hypothetical protein